LRLAEIKISTNLKMVENATMESKIATLTQKTNVSERGINNDPAFCFGPPIQKTNSGAITPSALLFRNLALF